jgi:hypothetical protein
LDIGPGAKLQGPMTFKNKKGEAILVLDATGTVAVKALPTGNIADKARRR